MNVQSLSALVLASRDPQRLAEFYRRHLGIPFECHQHGPTGDHHEATLGAMRLAVLERPEPGVSATFRVRNLDGFVDQLGRGGARPLHPALDLGQGKRLLSFHDADENLFSLIDLGF